jgi:hypothetical protein
MKRFVTPGLVALVVVLAVGAGLSPSLARASGQCVTAAEAAADAGKDDDPPGFGPSFFRRSLILEVSLDGADEAELHVSIEEVCNVPRQHRKEAAQIAGGEGVAVLVTGTTVRWGHARVPPKAVARALDRAGTAVLSVRLRQRRAWRRYEVGNPVPTFTTERITITG